MKFSECTLKSYLSRALDSLGFTEMTPIQEKMLPISLEGQDVIAQAPTGTGKTLAFALSAANKLTHDAVIQTLVLSPTRELTIQTTQVFNDILKDTSYKILSIYGGDSYDRQLRGLREHPNILIATPGRLIDHLHSGKINLDNLTTLVLDEADEMLDLGFREDIETILGYLNHPHQTLLMSATLNDEVISLAQSYLDNDAVTLSTSTEQLTVDNIEQKYIIINNDDKLEVMSRILDIHDFKRVMVFCNTKKAVDEVASSLSIRGYNAECLHGDMKQEQRERVMKRYKEGLVPVLVCSDVAARGVDVKDIDCVFNYDIPLDQEYYVHRVGRTGRAQQKGLAITLLTKRERYVLKDILRYSKAKIEPLEIPSLRTVIRNRTNRLLQNALALSKTPTPHDYDKILNEAIMSVDSSEYASLILGFLKQSMHNFEDYDEIDTSSNISLDTKEARKEYKGTRYFINIGSRDGFKINSFCMLIATYLDTQSRFIHDVDIHDSYSFFTLEEKESKKCFSMINGMRVNGRKLNVELADSKDKKQQEVLKTKSNRSNPNKVSDWDIPDANTHKEFQKPKNDEANSMSRKLERYKPFYEKYDKKKKQEEILESINGGYPVSQNADKKSKSKSKPKATAKAMPKPKALHMHYEEENNNLPDRYTDYEKKHKKKK